MADVNVLFIPQKKEINKTTIHFKTQFRLSQPSSSSADDKWQKLAIPYCKVYPGHYEELHRIIMLAVTA